jgi:hypothetical protein
MAQAKVWVKVVRRHCERSEAMQLFGGDGEWIAWLQVLLAMTHPAAGQETI